MQVKAPTFDRSADRGVVKLGKASRLTKASFDGSQVEMIPERQYKLGG